MPLPLCFINLARDQERRARLESELLRLRLDRRGVHSFDAVAARLDADGIPHRAPGEPVPCWRRGDAGVGVCASE